MSDEVDDLLRRAMATLDAQVPDGYFETLASRTVLRLDEPAAGDHDDDSGLEDIRTLASETAARLASRRSSRDLIVADDVASSSASWNAVALPEPARPAAVTARADVDELARERAVREARAAPASRASAAASSGAATATALARMNRRTNRRSMLAAVGIGLAAAAGAVIFVASRDGAVRRAEMVERARDVASVAQTANPAPAAPRPGVTSIEPPARGYAPAIPDPTPPAAHAGSAAGDDRDRPLAKLTMTKGGRPAGPKKTKGKPSDDGPEVIDAGPAAGNTATAVGKMPGSGKAAPSSGSGEPSLEELLHEGSGQGAKPSKPALEKKALNGDDIKRGMTAVAARAQACFAGTQGIAAVRLTVAPSGQVQKVTVTGVFAGTPVGACVERAVRAATFPPWDGGPQSVGYDYLLSD